MADIKTDGGNNLFIDKSGSPWPTGASKKAYDWVGRRISWDDYNRALYAAAKGKILEEDIEEKNNKIYYNPLKRILKNFPTIKGKFSPAPAGITGEYFGRPDITDSISFKTEIEFFPHGPNHIKSRIGDSEGRDYTEKELIRCLKMLTKK